MFTSNKYSKVYHKIIDQALTRSTIVGYTERHHILPRSLGGSDDEQNIAILTAKEHFVVHHLLTKMVSSTKAKHKMLFAFAQMCNTRASKHGYRLTSRLFEQLRTRMSESMQENNPMFDPENVKRWIAARANGEYSQSKTAQARNEKYWTSAKNREKLSEQNKLRWSNQETKDAHGAKMKQAWSDPEKRAKHSEAMKLSWKKRKGLQ